jgi:vesicle coat complex subunit
MIETGDLGEIKRVKMELKGESDYLPDSEYFRGIAEKFLRYAGVEVVDEGYDAVLRVYVTLEDDEKVFDKIFFISGVVRFSYQFRSETFITAMTELILKIFGIQPLKKVLKRESRELRVGVAKALGEIGDASAVDALIEALKDEDSDVRENSIDALVKIAKKDLGVVDKLIKALRDKDSDVRGGITKVLGNLGWDPKSEEERVLYYIAKGDWDECVKMGGVAVEFLIERLKDKNSDVHDKSIDALVKIAKKDLGVVDKLIKALKDEDSYVRISVAWALGEIGDARAVDALIEALRDEDRYVRESVAWALGAIGDARAVDSLIKTLKDDDYFVRESAKVALFRILGVYFEYDKQWMQWWEENRGKFLK